MLTKSLLAGLVSQWMVFLLLAPLVAEPMHPNGIIALLLAVLVVVTSVSAHSAGRWIVIGIIAATILLIKVNAGVLVVLALCFSLALRLPALRRRPVIAALTAIFIALPALVVVHSNVWLLLLAAVAMFLVGIALWRIEALTPIQARSGYTWLPAAIISWLALAGIIAWLRGTPPNFLWEPLVIRPFGLQDAFSIPFVVPAIAALSALTSIFLMWWLPRDNRQALVGTRIAAGGLGAGLLVTAGPAAIISLAWLPLTRGHDRPHHLGGQRGWELPALAVWFFLTVFPVAGSQVAVASILMVPILLQTFVPALSEALQANPDGRSQLGTRLGLGVIALAAVTTVAWSGTAAMRQASTDYETRLPFDHQRGDGVRLTADQTKILSDNAQWISDNCSTFYSLPGLNIYYSLTSLPIPGAATSTHWWSLLTEAEQLRVISDMESSARPCFIRDNSLTNFWLRGRPIPSGPLLDYLNDRYTPVQQFNVVELMTRKG